MAEGRSFLLRHKQKPYSLTLFATNHNLFNHLAALTKILTVINARRCPRPVSDLQPLAKILCLLIPIPFVRLCPSLCLLLWKLLRDAMDFTLRCNSLKCRRALNDRAVVTTCRLSLRSTEPDLITDNITAISSATIALTA